MANRIKTVSQYDGSNWINETPIGADASNIDVVTAGNTSRNLQDVLGTPPASGNITNNINSKVSTSGGDVADTIVSKDITNYDSSTEVDDDILTDTDAVISTNTSTLWSRFNLFRKKVSNNFDNYFAKSSLVGADPGVTITGDDSTAYTTAAINNYLSNVIGYTSASAPSAGTVASQLSTLNSNWNNLDQNRYWLNVAQKAGGSDQTFSQSASFSGYSTGWKSSVFSTYGNHATEMFAETSNQYGLAITSAYQDRMILASALINGKVSTASAASVVAGMGGWSNSSWSGWRTGAETFGAGNYFSISIPLSPILMNATEHVIYVVIRVVTTNASVTITSARVTAIMLNGIAL